MADSALPAVGTYFPGHVPFWGRTRQALHHGQHRLATITAVDEQYVTVECGDSTETLWTHAPTARALARILDDGGVPARRLSNDLFLIHESVVSLVTADQASDCRFPEDCGAAARIHLAKSLPKDDG
ncbi:hypothetical protein [Demequina sp. NBRC 110051]|uniref:hypothetical protein n=1 Tax=Demequina sp. NBRC 110051 TaxID=1570340 RepID=UPI000A06AB7E|nr:hypothetical protein [Demequina sp. NBRC 110051]